MEFDPFDLDGISALDDPLDHGGLSDIGDPFNNIDDEQIEKIYAEQEKLHNKELERVAFDGKRLCGKNAHAYKKEYDNIQMLEMWKHGMSYRKIAEALGCSPSTVSNRLNKLLGKGNR
jgi:DNA-binding NarL/FixJ family response regulator